MTFHTEQLGLPQTWVVHDRGLEYAGEVIVAETFDPAWGRALEGDLSFRLVFFTVPRRIPIRQIRDSRIALAVPRSSSDQTRKALTREIASIHEARERYVTAQDPDTMALRRSMQERETAVRGELARRDATTYSQGRVYTHSGISICPVDIFVQESPESWADRLASVVLQQAYPGLPFDHRDFPFTLTADGIRALFRGLFQGDRDLAGVARAYGPGLGLTRRESPNVFDASQCQVIGTIRRQLESRGGETPAQEMLGELTGAHGLTRLLALLYLMAFVRHARAEVGLAPGHRIESRQGGHFLGDRITWDLVPEVSFSEPLAERLGTIRLQPSLTWDTVLPYATLLVEGLEPSEDVVVIVDQEGRLLAALGRMAIEIEKAQEALTTLEASLGSSLPGAQEALEWLHALSVASGYREFYSAAQGSFDGPSGLTEALDLYQRLVELAALAPQIAQTKRYLDSMTFGQSHSELSLGRDSVAARIEPATLVANPSLWKSIYEDFRRLRTRYAGAYGAHHARYHQEALELRHRLENMRPHVEAIARFNGMPELGEPVGTEVQLLFRNVIDALRVCPGGLSDPSLERVPYCETCLLPLVGDIPRRDAEALFGAAGRAMREYNRRLSSVSVRRILTDPTTEQLEKFINLVQVADPSALANVLDDEVVEFLRRFMRPA